MLWLAYTHLCFTSGAEGGSFYLICKDLQWEKIEFQKIQWYCFFPRESERMLCGKKDKWNSAGAIPWPAIYLIYLTPKTTLSYFSLWCWGWDSANSASQALLLVGLPMKSYQWEALGKTGKEKWKREYFFQFSCFLRFTSNNNRRLAPVPASFDSFRTILSWATASNSFAFIVSGHISRGVC